MENFSLKFTKRTRLNILKPTKFGLIVCLEHLRACTFGTFYSLIPKIVPFRSALVLKCTKCTTDIYNTFEGEKGYAKSFPFIKNYGIQLIVGRNEIRVTQRL